MAQNTAKALYTTDKLTDILSFFNKIMVIPRLSFAARFFRNCSAYQPYAFVYTSPRKKTSDTPKDIRRQFKILLSTICSH